MLVPARRHDPEWMDREDNTRADLEGALADIGAVNRFLGGTRIVVEFVLPHLAASAPGRPLSVLDVGTGAADVPRALVEAARGAGRPIRVVAVDRDPVTAALARAACGGIPEIEVVERDAFALGFPQESFDIVTASLFLHHFGHDDAVKLVATFRRIARRAVLVNDLRRHAIPWAFIAVAARATRRHPMFVHDAPLSVLRGFTEGELRRIASDAGAPSATVTRRFAFRLLLTVPGGTA